MKQQKIQNHQQLAVIVPIYGVEEYLEGCLNSIISQTYTNLEIILVDDGSLGNEPAICDSYAEKDKRIKVIHKKNEGLLAARKTALEITTSDYVTFVDGDDYLSPQYYERMMHSIVENNADIIAAGYTAVSDERTEHVTQHIENGIYEGEGILEVQRNMNCKNAHYYDTGIFSTVWSKIYRTDLLKSVIYDIPSVIKMGEDAAITYPYLLQCKKAVVDNSINDYNYRIIQGSMSRTADERLITSTSLLCEYLKPIYYASGDKKIIEQYELYRVNLIMIIFDLWKNNVRFKDLHAARCKLQHLVKGSALFSDMDSLLTLDVPRYASWKLSSLTHNRWNYIELRWKAKYIVSKMLHK